MTSRRRSVLGALSVVALGVAAVVGAFLLGKQQGLGGAEQVAPPDRGLPLTPDYHALYVDPQNPRRLLLGTHAGLYESRDGGVRWTAGPLGRQDAMNIVRAPDGTLWVAGHNVLARSGDGGRTWTDVRPDGLPHLDLHGFAVDPDGRLYAAAAGSGLYRSTDGGATFRSASDEVGGSVYGLTAAQDGVLLAADADRGLLRSEDGGKSWRVVLAEPVIRVSASPADRDVVLATGARIWRSTDGGRTWSAGFDAGSTLEPLAWSAEPSPSAYTIAFDTRTLYRSRDAGETWLPVG